ncbi:PASTA domain-containing protein [Leifsonia aquatica]|uniref:PASTA domain-containing protein n=1 Tax=Leifsonia aquatica TaxID=144185 RepID=UPI0037F89963
MIARGRLRALGACAAVALTLGGLTACETVPPSSSDSAAPALLDVVGKPADKGVELLRNAGYRVAVLGGHGEPATASPTRLIVSQKPEGGAKVAAGRTVTLTLGDG